MARHTSIKIQASGTVSDAVLLSPDRAGVGFVVLSTTEADLALQYCPETLDYTDDSNWADLYDDLTNAPFVLLAATASGCVDASRVLHGFQGRVRVKSASAQSSPVTIIVEQR